MHLDHSRLGRRSSIYLAPIEEPIEEQVAELVPLVLLGGELGESIDTLVHRLADKVERDDLGFRSVSAGTVQRLIAERDEQAAEIRLRQAETTRRIKEREAKEPKFRVIPAPEEAPLGSALAVLRAAENEERGYHPFGHGEFMGGER